MNPTIDPVEQFFSMLAQANAAVWPMRCRRASLAECCGRLACRVEMFIELQASMAALKTLAPERCASHRTVDA